MHADKRFLDKYMPQFMYHLHYRIIDVSTIKELSRSVSLVIYSLHTVAQSYGKFLLIYIVFSVARVFICHYHIT